MEELFNQSRLHSKTSEPYCAVCSGNFAKSIGACDNLTIDISSSTGDGGRQWTSVSITVEGSSGSSADQLQAFLAEHLHLLPPIPIPYQLITKGFEYTFMVKMCNFLGVCNEASQTVSAIDTSIPLVVIPGAALVTVARNSFLKVQSSVSVSSCLSSSSSATISYSWSIWTNNSAAELKSISKDASKFILPPYSLQVKSFYTVTLTASIVGNSNSASASVSVYVSVGNIHSIVTGGLYRSMKVDSKIILDASRSYDEDVNGVTGAQAGLVFVWSCVRTSPSFNASCDGYLQSSIITSTAALTSLSAASGSSFQLTVVVTDASKTRASQSIITLQVLPKTSSIVTLTSNSLTGIVNPDQNLQLTGSVSVYETSNATAVWAVDDPGVNLDSIAVTRTRVSLTSFESTVYLVIPPNSLAGGMQLTFALSCRSAADSAATVAYVTIVTNAPPRPGVFAVSPLTGEELKTAFTFSSVQWIDSQLPLSYQYGYISSSSNHITLQSRSIATFGSSQLPAGSDSKGTLYSFAQVFDSLDANTTVSVAVSVTESQTSSSPSSIQSFLASSINGSRTVDDVKKSTAFTTYLMNKVNCSLAPNCSSLYRRACYGTINTCGSCLAGYIGDSGDSNSYCYPASKSIIASKTGECSTLMDCLTFQDCVQGRCLNVLKSCPFNCSNHGKCEFVEVDSGATIDHCFVGDSSCSAQCACDAEYLGSKSCDVSVSDFSIKQAVRYNIIENIIDITTTEYPSTEAVNGWIAAIVDATQSSEELSDLSANAVLNVSLFIIQTAETLSLSNNALSIILTAVNSATQRTGSGNKNSSQSSLLINNTLTNLKQYASIVGKNVLPGQNALQTIQSEFRLAVTSSSGESILTIPTDSLEQAVGRKSSSLLVNGSSSSVHYTLSFIQLRSGLYDNPKFK